MKKRIKFLTVAMAGVAALSHSALTYAAEPTELSDNIPGYLSVSRISPDKNEIAVTYYDTGTDVDIPIRVAIQWPNDGSEPDANGLGMAVPVWMTQIYERSTSASNAAQFVSGVEEIIGPSRIKSGISLKDNTSNLLYFGMSLNSSGSVRIINLKVDYRDCMKVYQEGVECLAGTDTDGNTIYEPWLNGVKLEVPKENDPEPKPTDPDPDPTPTDPTPDPDPNPTPTDPDPTPEPQPDPTPTEPDTPEPRPNQEPASQPESAPISEPESTISALTTYVSSHRTDPVLAYQPASNNVQLPVAGENQDISTTFENTTSQEVKSQNATAETPEVPELGGTTEKKGIFWWILAPVLIAGLGLAAWWFLPIFKRRRKEQEEN